MRRFGLALLIVSIACLAAPAFADEGAGTDCAVCSRTTSDNWGVKTGSQLGRGVANAGGCWLEMVNQPMKEAKGGGNVLVGVGKGIGHTGLRLVKGAGEIITAPLPQAKDGSQISTDCPMCMWRSS